MKVIIYIIIGLVVLVILLAVLIKPKEKPMIAYSWSDNLDPACITVDEIINKKEVIRVVYHDYGQGGWQFYDGKDLSNRKPAVIEKEEILKIDSSIKEILNLEAGWKAERKSEKEEWVISKINNFD